jgi:nucleotide-binding universal stress UspA family protein
VVLAHDGSDPALAAESLVRSWPMFERASTLVLSVVRIHAVWQEAMAMLTVGAGLERYGDEVAEARERLARVNRQVVLRLISERRQAYGAVEEGDPANVIVSTADELDADLVVIGTHGRAGMERLFLGSVARAVLLHTKASVLIARPVAVRSAQPAPGETPESAVAGALAGVA